MVTGLNIFPYEHFSPVTRQSFFDKIGSFFFFLTEQPKLIAQFYIVCISTSEDRQILFASKVTGVHRATIVAKDEMKGSVQKGH